MNIFHMRPVKSDLAKSRVEVKRLNPAKIKGRLGLSSHKSLYQRSDRRLGSFLDDKKAKPISFDMSFQNVTIYLTIYI